MNPSNGKGSMSTGSANSAWKQGDVVASDPFPAGLRVLLVDDDPTCLKILEKMLKTCLYEVTKCNRAEFALSRLRENKNGYDIVISDVHMPDMDGFKLLEHIGLEMDLPVIMMSADDSKNVVMKGVTHGACDYLIKPVRIEALKNIWQHVVRKRKNEWKDFEQSGSMEEGEKQPKQQSEDADYSSSANEGNWRNSKKRKEDEEELEEKDDNSTLKKPRVVWSVELHQQFVAAVNQLGIDKAVPKKILELMNVPGLTRENVASHLQKYRLYLRRLSGVSPHQSNLSHSILTPQEATYGSLSSISSFDLQALAASGQLPAQSLATLQAAGLGRTPAKTRILSPVVDQRNLFSFENPKARFGEGQLQHLSGGKQINLLHGIPTTMEPKQLANFNHSVQSLGNVNMQVNTQVGQVGQTSAMVAQVSQIPSTGQILSESTGIHALRLPNSAGPPVISNTISDGVAARNMLAENGRGSEFNPVSQTSSVLNFPLNNSVEMPGGGFPLGSTPAISSFASKGLFQEEVSSNMKVQGLMPSYDIFGDLHQQKPNSWETQYGGLNFNPSLQLNCDVDTRHSFVAHDMYSSGQTNGQNRNIIRGTMPMFSGGELPAHLSPQISGHFNSGLSENQVRIKAESNMYPEHIDQEDLMSALLKQGGNGQAENEFDFDGCHVGNIPV